MKKCMAIVHVGPAMGAAFTQYTAEFESGGELGETARAAISVCNRRRVKVEVKGKKSELGPRGYAYLPEGTAHRVTASRRRAAWR